jgi:DNA repair photolyase
LRDVDVLKEIEKNAVLPEDLKRLNKGVLITFSFSTLDESVRKIFEANAPKVEERISAIKNLKDKGFKVGIAFVPLLPFISDSEEQIEEMVKLAKELSVDYVFFGDLTLHGAAKDIFFRVLEARFPELVEKYNELYKGFLPTRAYRARLYSTSKRLCKKYGVGWGIA